MSAEVANLWVVLIAAGGLGLSVCGMVAAGVWVARGIKSAGEAVVTRLDGLDTKVDRQHAHQHECNKRLVRAMKIVGARVGKLPCVQVEAGD